MKKGKQVESKTAKNEADRSCQACIVEHLESRLADLRAIWKALEDGNGHGEAEHGRLHEYGLCFDYVLPQESRDILEPYFRYQISWGGPSDEFRFYAVKACHGWKPYRVEYWFLDWFDGASRTLQGEDLDLIINIFAWFDGAGATDSEYQRAMEN